MSTLQVADTLSSEKVTQPNFSLNVWFMARWIDLNAATVNRKVPGTLTVAFLALIVGLGSSWYFTSTGANLWYADAQSHLTIARRLFDSQNPGFQQLGTVWLPVPHLLLLPFVMSTWLWHTGWAAALLGTLCLVVSVAALYRIAARIGLGRVGRLTVCFLFLANPNILYTYTTALTEPVLIAAMLAAIAGLSGWMVSERKLSGGELAVFAGIPTAAAVLSRYEGWSLIVAGSLFVAIVSFMKYHDWKYSFRMIFSFAIVPFAAIVWWISYNFALFGNPLEFMSGEYSAAFQQQQISESGLLATKGSIGLSLWTYNSAVFYAGGIILLIWALVGLFVWVSSRWVFKPEGILVGLLVTPYVFSVLSLFLGQTAINNAYTLPYAWWNNRFALSSLPFLIMLAAIGLEWLIKRGSKTFGPRAAAVIVGVFVFSFVGQNIWWMQDFSQRSAIYAEAVSSQKSNVDSVSVAQYLQEHYDGGYILIDETSGGHATLPLIGLPLDEYVNRSTGEIFDAALRNPAKYVQWVVVYTGDDPSGSGPGDVVLRELLKNPEVFSQFALVYETPTQAVYKRVS